MQAKDCLVLAPVHPDGNISHNGQPLQSYILICPEHPDITIHGINPYMAKGLLDYFYEAISGRLQKGIRFEEMAGPQQPQGARIEIGGVVIDPVALSRAQSGARLEETVEKLQTQIESLMGEIKTLKEKPV